MPPIRRRLLLAGPALLAATRFAVAQGPAPAADPRMAERADGPATAKSVVQEWFSLTCTHCARFAADVFPQIKSELIDTGKIRYVFRDYPLDQTALLAAMIARSLPPERYQPFVLTLFATQKRWAFDREADPKEELARMAALAGMPRADFDKVAADDALKNAILAEQAKGEAQYHIDATPTFVFGSKVNSGEMSFDAFKAAALA